MSFAHGSGIFFFFKRGRQQLGEYGNQNYMQTFTENFSEPRDRFLPALLTKQAFLLSSAPLLVRTLASSGRSR